MKYDVFISYSRKDSEIVKRFADELGKAGYTIWMDIDGIETGDEFKSKIVSAIKDSALFLFFWSKDSNVSEWTVKEVNVAVNLKKQIIPVKLDSTIYNDSLLFDLGGLDYILYNGKKETITKLMRSLEKRITTKVVEENNKQKIKDADSLFNKGRSAYNGKRYDEAVAFYIKAANSGHIGALVNLGLCYLYGKGVSQSNEVAVRMFQDAAVKGNVVAQFNLAMCYEKGIGVEYSEEDAAIWYHKAAEQGHAKAQYNIGFLYEIGLGVPQSYSEAVKWYRKSAEQGNAVAQYFLGICYYEGNGVPQSYSETVKWYRRAADQGCQDAKDALKRLGY